MEKNQRRILCSGFTTREDGVWNQRAFHLTPSRLPADLVLCDSVEQRFEGWGGCFNELGWQALNRLDEAERNAVLDDLFLPNRLGLIRCRVPIGASDYALDWYSCDETPGDLELKHFSIERDRRMLIPYIREALRRQPDLKLFASPWSPPTWMKSPPVYNYGSLSRDPSVRDAYARYLLSFVRAYQTEGLPLDQLHVQNEPVSTQKFPSCVMTGVELRDFIRDHLGPVFERADRPAAIWLGTLNGPETDNRWSWTQYGHYAALVLHDPRARRHIAGIGYQWAGKNAVQKTRWAWPDLPLMQTENECGNGANDWAFAWYLCEQILHYLLNDAVAYVWWNMALEPGGESTWGWKQNALVTCDPSTRRAIWNPDSVVLRHFATALRPGSRRIVTTGSWTPLTVAAQHDDGMCSVVVRNPFPEAATLRLGLESDVFAVDLPADSLSTIHLKQEGRRHDEE